MTASVVEPNPEQGNNRLPITEEMKVHEDWYKRARQVNTTEELTLFIHELTTKYTHDYGTIIHACTAAAIAAAHVVDTSEQGGITGFQASGVMWEFIQNWMHINHPLRMIHYDNMLYPQYAHNFDKTISTHVWEWLQEEAKKHLADTHGGIHGNVAKHWQSIVDGRVPFGYTVRDDA